MRALAVLIALAPLFTDTTPAQSVYDRHIAFDNSLTDKSHYYSSGSYVAPSELELVNGKLPVEERNFMSPPNALRLKWRSQNGGDWQASLNLIPFYRRVSFSGRLLSFWCYSDADLPSAESPLIYLRDANGEGTPSIRLIGSLEKIPAKKWTLVKLPFNSFFGIAKSTGDIRFDGNHAVSITIVQGLDDGGKPHALYIDDVRIGDDTPDDGKPPATPANLSAKGYDSHVDLTWRLNAEADLQHYKIYRSFDGKNYTPVGIQKGHLARYADFVGGGGKTAFYKISAVDTNNDESPLSNEVKTATHTMTDEELLTMVQEACFRYYWDAAHAVAGMAIEILPGD